MKEQILIMVEQMQAGDDYLLKLVSTLPLKDQAEFLPLVIDSIEKTQNIVKSLRNEAN